MPMNTSMEVKTKWENMHANVIIMKTEKTQKQEKNERRREQRQKKAQFPEYEVKE